MPAHPRYLAPISLLALLAAAALPDAALADIIHLKNGATIAADSWQEDGSVLVVRQPGGTMRIPRADVERIETTPASTPAAAEDPRPGAGTGAGAAVPTLPRDEALRRVDELRRRIRELPLTRAADTRQLVVLIIHLGSEAYQRHDLDEALAHFREATVLDGSDPRAPFGLAATYLAQGQDVYARTTLERALIDHPDDADLLALLGDVYDAEERPEEALTAWEKSQQIKPNDAVRARIEKLRREHQIDGAYQRSDAAHFTLKYDGGRTGPDLEAQILAYLETEFTSLVVKFDHYPRQPIVVIVYPKRQFHEATQAESTVGGLFDGKIRVPIGGLARLNDESRAVLIHELGHAFIAGKSRGVAPRWLHEGLAQYLEGRVLPAATEASLAAEFRVLDDTSSWGETFSYPSALSFVRFLVEREGFYRLVEILQSLGEGTSLHEATQQATRYTLTELRQAWGEELVRKHLQ